MYHIKNDKRSRDSAVTIYYSLRHLLKVKSLSDITISDISNECGVSRSTFYRNFDNLVDVLEYRFDEFYREYLDIAKSKTNKLLYFFEFWDRHSDLVYILTTQNEQTIKKVIKNNTVLTSDEVTNQYLVDIRISAMTSLLCRWVERNKKESPREMETLARNMLNIPAIKLLLND